MFRPPKGQDVTLPDFVGEVPEAPAERVQAFRDQLAEWVRSGRVGVPLLVLPDAPDPAEGRCISCGEPLAPEQTWRCGACLAAVKAALAERPR